MTTDGKKQQIQRLKLPFIFIVMCYIKYACGYK